MLSSTYEVEVASRFDAVHGRFKRSVAGDDYRLRAIRKAIGPFRGLNVLDLGCGKGRFAREIQAEGAWVAGLDCSSAMLHEAEGIARVRGSAARLPFEQGTFDRVVAVEVLEHVEPRRLPAVLAEVRRVLRPEGLLAIVDKSVLSLNAQRPWLPSVVVKRIDQMRGRWMYPHGGPVRERWFWPSGLRRELCRWFAEAWFVHLLSPPEESSGVFHRFPATRLMTLWVARARGGDHV